jgi:hypothetical protein
VAGSCGRGNEPLGSLKVGESPSLPQRLSGFQEGHCFMEIDVTHTTCLLEIAYTKLCLLN